MNRFRPDRIDPIRVAIVAVLAIVALFVWSVARDRVATPFDEFVTERTCTDHGDDLGRELISYQRSNRFGLSNRTDASCSFGAGPDGEAPITLTMDEIEPGLQYQVAKWIGIIAQLGIVSIFLRLTIDPALGLYRYARSWFD